MRKPLLPILIALLIATGLVGCGGSSEPLLGKWKSTSSDTLEEFYSDGTYSYTNSKIPELGYLKGEWEKFDKLPTIKIDGKEWNVYLFTDETREKQGSGQSGNKYDYGDGQGDWYYITDGKTLYLTIGYGNLERIQEDGFSDTEEQFKSVRTN